MLGTFLYKRSDKFKETEILDALDEIVTKEVKMSMDDVNARYRIENLFVAYHGI